MYSTIAARGRHATFAVVASVGLQGFESDTTVKDAGGRVVGASMAGPVNSRHTINWVAIDSNEGRYAPGPYTAVISTNRALPILATGFAAVQQWLALDGHRVVALHVREAVLQIRCEGDAEARRRWQRQVTVHNGGRVGEDLPL